MFSICNLMLRASQRCNNLSLTYSPLFSVRNLSTVYCHLILQDSIWCVFWLFQWNNCCDQQSCGVTNHMQQYFNFTSMATHSLKLLANGKPTMGLGGAIHKQDTQGHSFEHFLFYLSKYDLKPILLQWS